MDDYQAHETAIIDKGAIIGKIQKFGIGHIFAKKLL